MVSKSEKDISLYLFQNNYEHHNLTAYMNTLFSPTCVATIATEKSMKQLKKNIAIVLKSN